MTNRFQGKLVRTPWFYRQWMVAGNPALFLDRIIHDFGDFVNYRGLFNFYLINHPELIKQVLQETHKNFDKQTVIYDRFRIPFNNGLVVSEGEHWKRQRKLMQPMFVPGAARQFFDLMKESATQMTDRWQPRCRAGTVFNIAEDMNRIAMEIAGRALFHDGFQESADKIAHWTEVINSFSARPPVPIVGAPWFPTRLNRRLQKTLREFRIFLVQLINNRRQHSPSSMATSNVSRDLLTILIEARDEDTGQPMSDEQLIEEVLGMIIGGHEATSSALAWLWYELNAQPDVLSKVEEEVDRVVGRSEVTLSGVSDLSYTRMVIEETLRLHPPFWFDNRNVMHDVELGGSRLPRGAIVAFSRYSLHRHPQYWREANRFLPERFAQDREENPRSNGAFIPFGHGPRLCIGMNFAMLELLVIVAVVVQRFRVKLSADNRHEMGVRLTMAPRYGVKVRLEDRTQGT